MQDRIFHHIGFPVTFEDLNGKKGVRYSPLFDMYSLNLKNDLGIPMEAHAFGSRSSLHKRIRTQQHTAFKVKSLAACLEGKSCLLPPYQPFSGYQCAIIDLNGQLVELIETDIPEEELWGDAVYKESILYPDGKS